MNLRDRMNIYRKREPTGRLAPSLPGLPGAEKIDYRGRTLLRFSISLEEGDPLFPSPPPGIDEGLAPYRKFNRIGAEAAIRNLLFLDLETTSLSTGAGNVPFLIGLGAYRDRAFTVEQYFLDDYSEEGALLEYLLPRFREAGALVTYNGKTFDVPLLKSRYRMNRVPSFPVDIPVIDLFHPCRRIFKSLYDNCSLKTIEEKFLGITRGEDIPGWLIPDVFFRFQKYGETDRLPLVIEHNRRDVASMFSLLFMLNEIYRLVESRDHHLLHRRALANLANHAYVVDLEAFLDLIRYMGDEVFHNRSLFKKFSTALKRTGRLTEAVAFWKKIDSVYSLEELAKHHEHREREFGCALEECSRAVALLEQGLFSPAGDSLDKGVVEFYRTRYDKRMERLLRKLRRGTA